MGLTITDEIVKVISLKEKMATDLFLAQPKKVSSFATFTPLDAITFFSRLGVCRGPIEESVAQCETLCAALNSLGPTKMPEIEKMIKNKEVSVGIGRRADGRIV